MSLTRRYLSFFLAGACLIGTAAWLDGKVWADRLNFYDGKVTSGHITEVSGDIIRYREGFLREFTTRRLRLSDRQDIVTTWGNKKYIGEVHYIDGVSLEIITNSGRLVIWKAMVKDVEMGSRVSSAMPSPANTMMQPGNVQDPATRYTDDPMSAPELPGGWQPPSPKDNTRIEMDGSTFTNFDNGDVYKPSTLKLDPAKPRVQFPE